MSPKTVIFITGPPFSGKTRLLERIGKRGYAILSAQEIISDIEATLRKKWHEDPSLFTYPADLENETDHQSMALLVDKIESSRDQVLFVEDDYMERYIHKISEPKKVALVFRPLKQLAQGLAAQTEHVIPAERVLQRLFRSFEPIIPRPAGKCATLLRIEDLAEFEEVCRSSPIKHLSKRLTTSLRSLRKSFFRHGRKTVCLGAREHYDFHVDLVLGHTDTGKAVDKILSLLTS